MELNWFHFYQMNNMFRNECGYMFDTNSCFITGKLININDKVAQNRMLNCFECMGGGFSIPVDSIKDEECSPHAWG